MKKFCDGSVKVGRINQSVWYNTSNGKRPVKSKIVIFDEFIRKHPSVYDSYIVYYWTAPFGFGHSADFSTFHRSVAEANMVRSSDRCYYKRYNNYEIKKKFVRIFSRSLSRKS